MSISTVVNFLYNYIGLYKSSRKGNYPNSRLQETQVLNTQGLRVLGFYGLYAFGAFGFIDYRVCTVLKFQGTQAP